MSTATVAGPDKRREERGATAVEYGLMIALIAAVIFMVAFFLGQDAIEMFQTVCTGSPFNC